MVKFVSELTGVKGNLEALCFYAVANNIGINRKLTVVHRLFHRQMRFFSCRHLMLEVCLICKICAEHPLCNKGVKDQSVSQIEIIMGFYLKVSFCSY